MPSGLNPYTLSNLLSGQARVLFAPIDSDVPDDLSDIIELVGPDYAPVDDWEDFGAARESSTYARDISTEDLTIQQETGAVITDITDAPRTLQVSIAEITPEHLQIVEQSGDPQTIAAGANRSSQKKVPFGTIDDLTRYRICMIGRRHIGIGTDVTEPGGTKRGGFVAVVLLSCALSADKAELELDKGKLAHLPVGFTAFPVEGQDAGEETGFWIDELTGTIAGS